MSSRLDLKNETIAKYFSEIKELFSENIRFLTYSTLLFFLISIFYSFALTPKFSVSSIIVSNQPEDTTPQVQ